MFNYKNKDGDPRIGKMVVHGILAVVVLAVIYCLLV